MMNKNKHEITFVEPHPQPVGSINVAKSHADAKSIVVNRQSSS